MKTTLTEQEHYVLIGLTYLANKKMKELEDLIKVGCELVGEDDMFGHVSDEFFSGEANTESLLNRLNIEISRTGD